MTPRLNKRQQRELDELSALVVSQDEALSSEDERQHPSTKITAGFSMLFTPEDDSVDEQSLPTSKARKKKKKKSSENADSMKPSVLPEVVNTSAITTRSHQPVSPQAKSEKKALKKARARERKAGHEELDRALAELSVQYPELKRTSTVTSGVSTQNTLSSVLSVSLSHLDCEAELRRFFGSKVISASKATEGSSPGAPLRRKSGRQRSYLAHAQPAWWAPRMHEGLSVAPLSKDQLDDKLRRQSWEPIDSEKWWTIEYSKKYKAVTMAFMKIVVSGDPDGFWDLLGKLPGHADTLLQLSEVYRYREEYGQAVSFVERALFTYERSLIGAVPFTTGLNRLDFDCVENRPFFLAIHRQVTDLQRRGCFRTAFEFARLLYSLEPWNDPYGALLHLDYLSVKAGMSQWLFDSFDHFAGLRESGQHHKARIDPSLLPGWVYTRALAMRIEEDSGVGNKNHESSTSALKDAILSFPSVVPLLADKLDISLSAQIRSKGSFRIEISASSLTTPEAAIHLLSHLYVQRSFSIWKDSAHSTWFSDTVASVCASMPSEFPSNPRRLSFLDLYTLPSPRYSLYRHVTVLDDSYRRLSSFMPAEVLRVKTLNCDPLPPPTCVSNYDEEFFKGVEDLFAARARTRQDRAADERLLETLIPDRLFREQLQAFFAANPQVAERFPGGIVQFAQLAARLPEDMLEGMMIAEAVGDEGWGHGDMPGQLPGEDMVAVNFGDDEAEEGPASAAQAMGGFDVDPLRQDAEDREQETTDEDDDEGIMPMPIRLMRSIMNRFWPRSGSTDTDDSSDDRGNADGVD